MIRVFPRRTKWTPIDELAFIGFPPLFLPPEQPVRISVSFTWDIPLAQKLYLSWKAHYGDVQLGGPAFDDAGGEFVPGRFLKEGVTITSRGCIRHCKFCLVPKREGRIRELPIREGWIIQDNNLLACSQAHIDKVFEMLAKQSHPAIFAAGLDARLLQGWHIERFKSLKNPQLWFACDSLDALLPLALASNLLKDFPQKYCYALIGYDPRETMREAEIRLREIWNLGFYPFAMLYRGANDEGHRSKEWKRFQRTWCRPAAYKTLIKGENSGN